jgi:hypothetical protein
MTSVAVMTLLPPIFDEKTKNTLLSSWQSIYKQTYPTETLYFYFSVRAELFAVYRVFLMENFKLSYTLLSGPTYFTGSNLHGEFGEARFKELVAHRNILLQNGKKHDYGFFVDSDVLIPPWTIKRFIENNLQQSMPFPSSCSPIDIIGGVVLVPIINIMSNGEHRKSTAPGFGNFIYKNGFLHGSRFSTVIPANISKVDFVNTACMFLSHKVMNDAKVKFCLVPSVGGEDHSYCYIAAKNGYDIRIDPSIRCLHRRRGMDGVIRDMPYIP